jgi:hypothetical protein
MDAHGSSLHRGIRASQFAAVGILGAVLLHMQQYVALKTDGSLVEHENWESYGWQENEQDHISFRKCQRED